MSDHHVYKKVEIVGSSRVGIEDAINNALAECSKSIQNLEWFEVVETRGHVQHGQVGHYQVVLKVGFRIQGSCFRAAGAEPVRMGELSDSRPRLARHTSVRPAPSAPT